MKNKGLYGFILLLMCSVSAPVWARKHRIIIPAAFDQPSCVDTLGATGGFYRTAAWLDLDGSFKKRLQHFSVIMSCIRVVYAGLFAPTS